MAELNKGEIKLQLRNNVSAAIKAIKAEQGNYRNLKFYRTEQQRQPFSVKKDSCSGEPETKK